MKCRAEICVAGELLWDHHADDTLERATHFRRVLGGAAANVALAMVEQGLVVAVAGVVGDDALGRGIRRALDDAGVDTSALELVRGQTGSVFIEPLRDGTQRFYSYRPSVAWPTRPKLPWGRGALHDRVLHIAALNPDELEVMRDLAERVVSRGGVVTVDVNARPRAWRGVRMSRARRAALAALCESASLVKVSDDDLRVLGVQAPPGAHTFVITRGKGTMTLMTRHGEARVRPPKVDARRCIGAGDAFSANLVAGIARDALPASLAQWKRAVRRASADAARHLQRAEPK